MARKVDGLKKLPAVCEGNQFDNFILGEIMEVLNQNKMIIQPFGREEIYVDVRLTEIFDIRGEKISMIPLQDPAVFLVKIYFRDNKVQSVFLVERELVTEPVRIVKSVTFNLDTCHHFQEEPEPESESIFLSESNHVAPVDVDADEDSIESIFFFDPSIESIEAEAKYEAQEIISTLNDRIEKLAIRLQYKENQFDHLFSASVDRINKLEIQLQDKETEFIKERAKFNLAMKEKEKKINLLGENLRNKDTLIDSLLSQPSFFFEN